MTPQPSIACCIPINRSKYGCLVAKQESRKHKSPPAHRPAIPRPERLLDSFRESRTEAPPQPRARGRSRWRDGSVGGGGRLRPSVPDGGDWSDSDLSDNGVYLQGRHSSPGRPERRPPQSTSFRGGSDTDLNRIGGAGVEADRARAARAQRGPPGR